MKPNPSGIEKQLLDVQAGWEEHAAQARFSELTLAQYKAKVKPSLDARERIRTLELQLDAERVARDNADIISIETTLNVVSSVKGDPACGEDSAVYASFGYVRKSARKSGLTRATAAAGQPAVKVAA